jgi:hypothetical protein
VPSKLFTLFATPERATAHIRRLRARLVRVAKRIGDCDEWGVRAALEPSPVATPRPTRAAGSRSGTSFLQAKLAAREAAGRAQKDATRAAGALYAELSRLARAARDKPSSPGDPTAGLLALDAVFLVPRARRRAFLGALERAQRSLPASGLRLARSGPWPPYHFVDA